MKQHDKSELATQPVAERMELFLDEATALATSWFGERAETDRAVLIVQMASAMLQREGAEFWQKPSIALKGRKSDGLGS